MISVITPVYNTGNLILDLAESLKKQVYEDMEWVVVDDGSDSATREVLLNLQQEIPWMRLFFQETNKGACAARNRGIRESHGEWVKFVDADDFLSDNMLQAQAAIVVRRQVDIVVSPAVRVEHSQNGIVFSAPRRVEKEDIYLLNLIRNPRFHCSGCLFRKSLVQSVEGWNEHLKADQDGDFLYRIWQKQPEIEVCNECTFYYRDHQLTERITQGISEAKIKSRLWVCAYMMAHPGILDRTALQQAVAVKMNQIAYMAVEDRSLFSLVEAGFRETLGPPHRYGRGIEKFLKRLVGYRRFIYSKKRLICFMRKGWLQ